MKDTLRSERPAGGRPTFAAPAGRTGLRASSAPRVPFLVLLLALVVGGMGLLLLLNTASAANELSRQHYAESDTSVSAQVALLRNQVADSAAPSNLASAAAALGMVPGGNPAFLVVGPDGKVTVRGSAAPASEVQVQVPKAKTKHPKPKPSTTPTPGAKPTATKSAGAKTSATRGAKPKPSTTTPGAKPTSAKPSSTKSSPAKQTTSPRTHRTGGHR